MRPSARGGACSARCRGARSLTCLRGARAKSPFTAHLSAADAEEFATTVVASCFEALTPLGHQSTANGCCLRGAHPFLWSHWTDVRRSAREAARLDRKNSRLMCPRTKRPVQPCLRRKGIGRSPSAARIQPPQLSTQRANAPVFVRAPH